jgi:FMN phosphatase YigB (HAD superfamily)
MKTKDFLGNEGEICCIIFDFGFTLSSDLYFNVAPPECPDWQNLIQRHIFSDPVLVDDWMKADVTLEDIAKRLAPVVCMKIPRIVDFLELGCRNLNFNQAVLNFAIEQRKQGRKTAIVTGNMDVFTKIVVPWHHLADKFDGIINSFDHCEIDKALLWPKAFELVGNGIGYRQSLLIEDGEKNVAKFREKGGYAYQYSNDEQFLRWLKSNGW